MPQDFGQPARIDCDMSPRTDLPFTLVALPSDWELEPSKCICLVMEPDEKRKYLAAALRDPEIRRACLLVDRIITAGDMLDHIAPTTLEVVRDYCAEQARGITGTDVSLGRHGLSWW